MAITGVCHIAIGVRDMEASLAFYRDGLGLTVSIDRVEVEGGMYPRNRRACYLRWTQGPGSPFLVLDQHLTEQPPRAAAQMYEPGVHHVAFFTDDIAGTAARLKAAGYQVRHEGHVGTGQGFGEPDGDHRVATLFADDPDGNIIQFDQWLD